MQEHNTCNFFLSPQTYSLNATFTRYADYNKVTICLIYKDFLCIIHAHVVKSHANDITLTCDLLMCFIFKLNHFKLLFLFQIVVSIRSPSSFQFYNIRMT